MMIICFLDPPNAISIVDKIGTFLPEKNHDSGTTGGDRILCIGKQIYLDYGGFNVY